MNNTYVYQLDPTGNTTFFEYVSLPASQTSWRIPVEIPGGTNTTFYLQYTTNYATPLFVASTPTNTIDSQPIAGWTSTSTLETLVSSGFTTQLPASPDGTHTLIAHYAFDDSGDLGRDSSGNGNDMAGASWWGPVHQFATDAAAGAGALEFFGTSSLTPSDSTRTNWDQALAGSFTISAWVKTTASRGNDDDNAYFGATIFWAFNDQNATNDTIPLAITGSKGAFTTRGGDPGKFTTVHSTTSVNDGTYHLITVTRNQSTGEKKLYVDGSFEMSEFGTTAPLNGNDYYLSIGGTTASSYVGLADDLQFYSGVLSADEVAYLHTHPGSAVTNSSATIPLAVALNANELTWTNSGDATWFGQTAVSHDGVAAAQSGVVTNSQTSTLQTTVTGPGTLTFWWQNPGNDPDFDLEFDIDGTYVNDILGPTTWTLNGPYAIGPGTHTLTWIAAANGSMGPTNAAYLDQVLFVPEVDVALRFEVQRVNDAVYGEYYLMSPFFDSVLPAPVTQHSVKSPNGLFKGLQGGPYTSSSTIMSTLVSLLDECTNGLWTLTLNEGDPSEHQYTFRVALSNLTTSVLTQVSILNPTNGSVNVPTNSPLRWSGPASFSSIFADVYLLSGGGGGYTNLPATATDWPYPPILSNGTNQLYVSYSTNSFPFISATTPVDAASQPVTTWTVKGTLTSSASSRFVVGLPAPLPVRLTDIVSAADHLQFSFASLVGRPYTIQARTNLAAGTWLDLTNVTGDGTLQQFTFPTTNPPVRFFRVRSD